TLNTAAGDDPNQTAAGAPDPRAQAPARARSFSRVSVQRAIRQETVQADYTTTPAQTANGGAIISTKDTVALGFGLEQVDQTTRDAIVARAMGYLLPTTADTTAPAATFSYPADNQQETPADPVEAEVDAS